MENELISRNAAIEAVETIGFDFSDSDLSAVELEEVCEAIGEVRQEWLQRIKRLPSAQPETHEKRTETHACDCISRKAAIDAHYEYCNKHPDASFPVWSLKILEDLPSAQPEVLARGEGELIAQPEIVRCKDCENWIPGYITDNDDFIPPKCGKYQQMVGHSSDDYCSLAERRTDEGD